MKETDKIFLKIITPDKVVLEDTVEQVSLPTEAGEITILPNHIPLITNLMPGILESRKNGDGLPMAVSGGFMEFHGNQLTILADTAERAEEIDLEEAEAARKRAEQMKSDQSKNMNENQYASVVSIIDKQMARIKLAKRFHTTKGMGLGNGEKK